MTKLTRKALVLFVSCLLLQLTVWAQKPYYTNLVIPYATNDNKTVCYLLLHKFYRTGDPLMPDHYVQGKITATRGDIGAYNRKWSVEVNTGMAYNANFGNIVSYNEPADLKMVTYHDTAYIAVEIRQGATLNAFAFTGWAQNARFLLIDTTGVVATDFINYNPTIIGGPVAIGSKNAGTNKLTVNGNFAARKVIVTQATNWPDFVFKDGYKLPPLRDVEKFVKEHYHLPGVPSEIEIKDKGQDLGELNKALLQKTEELTLYIIEQQKQLSNQQKQIDSLIQQLKK